MGYNTSIFDREKYYNEKSFSDLLQLRVEIEKLIEDYPNLDHGSMNEHLHYLKLKIAERIGNKKEN